jgi:hypothetical protein
MKPSNTTPGGQTIGMDPTGRTVQGIMRRKIAEATEAGIRRPHALTKDGEPATGVGGAERRNMGELPEAFTPAGIKYKKPLEVTL